MSKKTPNPDVIKCSLCKLPTHIKAMEKHMAFYHPNVKEEALAPVEPTVKSQEDEVSPIHLTVEEIAPAQSEEPATDPVLCKTCQAINEHLSEYGHSHDSVVETVESFCGEYDRLHTECNKLQMKDSLSRCDIDTLRKDKKRMEDALKSTSTRLRMFEMLVDELSSRYDLEKQIGVIWSMLK
jgi:hypothetical protein